MTTPHEQLLVERQEAIDHGTYVEQENDRLRAQLAAAEALIASQRQEIKHMQANAAFDEDRS